MTTLSSIDAQLATLQTSKKKLHSVIFLINFITHFHFALTTDPCSMFFNLSNEEGFRELIATLEVTKDSIEFQFANENSNDYRRKDVLISSIGFEGVDIMLLGLIN